MSCLISKLKILPIDTQKNQVRPSFYKWRKQRRFKSCVYFIKSQKKLLFSQIEFLFCAILLISYYFIFIFLCFLTCVMATSSKEAGSTTKSTSCNFFALSGRTDEPDNIIFKPSCNPTTIKLRLMNRSKCSEQLVMTIVFRSKLF